MFQSFITVSSIASMAAFGVIASLEPTTPSFMEITSDARTVTLEPALVPTRILRCGSGSKSSEAEIIEMATKTILGSPIPWQTCNDRSAANGPSHKTLAFIIEAAEVPVIWHCQRQAPMSTTFSSCVKLGVLTATARPFEQLVRSIGSTPLFLASPDDMTHILRDG